MTFPYPGKGKVRKEAPQSPADLPFFFPWVNSDLLSLLFAQFQKKQKKWASGDIFICLTTNG